MRKNLRKILVSFSIGTAQVLATATLALADGPAAPVAGGGAGSSGQPSPLMSFVPFVLMFGVIYFLMIRPQQKKAKDQQEMMNALKQGDEVLTTSGILGKITGVTEKVVTVEVADNVRVKMLKSQVAQIVKGNLKDLA
ncbi:preprotein translocase subunit YajC [Bdellovibrionota bacterium FG-1]